MRGHKNKVVVILGDGELNEGSIWEAALVASAFKLDNLIAIVDRNKFQANIETEKLIPLRSITEKFEAFGWGARSLDGHNFDEMSEGFASFPIIEGSQALSLLRLSEERDCRA